MEWNRKCSRDLCSQEKKTPGEPVALPFPIPSRINENAVSRIRKSMGALLERRHERNRL